MPLIEEEKLKTRQQLYPDITVGARTAAPKEGLKKREPVDNTGNRAKGFIKNITPYFGNTAVSPDTPPSRRQTGLLDKETWKQFGRNIAGGARNIAGAINEAGVSNIATNVARTTGLLPIAEAVGGRMGDYIEPIRKFSPTGETVGFEKPKTIAQRLSSPDGAPTGGIIGKTAQFFGERAGLKEPTKRPAVAAPVAPATPGQAAAPELADLKPGEYFIQGGKEVRTNIPGRKSFTERTASYNPDQTGSRPTIDAGVLGRQIAGGMVTPEQRKEFLERTSGAKYGPGGMRLSPRQIRETTQTDKAAAAREIKHAREQGTAREIATTQARGLVGAATLKAASERPQIATLDDGTQVVMGGGRTDVVRPREPERVTEVTKYSKEGFPVETRSGVKDPQTGKVEWEPAAGEEEKTKGKVAVKPVVNENMVAAYMKKYPAASREDIIKALEVGA